jgi:hypothetical protein
LQSNPADFDSAVPELKKAGRMLLHVQDIFKTRKGMFQLGV